MIDGALSPEELSKLYGPGYALILKMGYTTSNTVPVPIPTDYSPGAGLGYQYSKDCQHSQLDKEFDDMLNGISLMTTKDKVPNCKAKFSSAHPLDVSGAKYITKTMATNVKECSRTPENILSSASSANWEDVSEQTTDETNEPVALVKLSFSMKKTRLKQADLKPSAFSGD